MAAHILGTLSEYFMGGSDVNAVDFDGVAIHKGFKRRANNLGFTPYLNVDERKEVNTG